MDANESLQLDTGNSIEFCEAVPRGPYVDIPLKDLTPIVAEVLRRDLLSARETTLILNAAASSAQRQKSGSTSSLH